MKEENKKWFLVSVVILGVLMTWILGEFLTFVGGYFNFHLKPIIGIFPAYFSISALINLTLVIYVIRSAAIATFAMETVTEVKKVAWPTPSETTKSTGVVLIAVFISAMILWFYDSILTWALKLLLGTES